MVLTGLTIENKKFFLRWNFWYRMETVRRAEVWRNKWGGGGDKVLYMGTKFLLWLGYRYVFQLGLARVFNVTGCTWLPDFLVFTCMWGVVLRQPVATVRWAAVGVGERERAGPGSLGTEKNGILIFGEFRLMSESWNWRKKVPAGPGPVGGKTIFSIL